MRRTACLLMTCLLPLVAHGQVDGNYWQKWNGEWTTPSTRQCILWFTANYGASIGAKAVLESSGGADMNHGEDSHGPLGINLPEAKKWRPGYTDEALRDLLANDWNFAGQLAAQIDSANYQLMVSAGKLNPRLDAAMVYPGWKNWNNPERLSRGLLDLSWQDFLEGMMN